MKIPNNNEKKTNSKRLLIYKPRKGQELKQWKIEGIVNDRITLIPVKQKKNHQTLFESTPVLDYVQQKQYEIAWQQGCQKGIWPNTWQPQENIPDFTRLDYLLRKKTQLKISKKKSREMRIKAKESFKQHQLFSTRKMNSRSETKISLEQMRQNVKRVLDKKENQQEQKNQKIEDYKEWFISYNFDPEEYQKLIERFLNGTKNTDTEKMEIIDENKSVKIHQDQNDLSFAFHDEKLQDRNLKTDEASISFTKTQKQQEPYTRSISHAFSSGPSRMFIKDIRYIGDDNEVDYFMIILFDDTQRYISEEDLVKYFPFVYEKYLMRKIDESIDDCRSCLMGLNHELNFMHLSCIKNLGGMINLKKEDFDLNYQVQNIFNSKNAHTSITDAQFIFGDRQVQIEQKKTHLQMQKQTQSPSSLFPKTIESKIHNYFYFLKEISHQDEIIQLQINNQDGNKYCPRQKQNVLFKATRCKELFKLEEVETQKRQKKQLQKNSSNTIQVSMTKLQIKNIQKPNQTQEKIQIKLFEKMQKNTHFKNSKINNEEKQICQILNVLENASKRQDNFYDSDDEEN